MCHEMNLNDTYTRWKNVDFRKANRFSWMFFENFVFVLFFVCLHTRTPYAHRALALAFIC